MIKRANVVHVVAALIWNRDQFLICQRPAHKKRGLLWEFVGGKVEAGETLEQALIRECKEELDVFVEPSGIYMELDHKYPDIHIHLTLYNASISSGTPKLLEHNDIRWIYPAEISQYTFCPADEEILQRITDDAQIHRSLKALADPAYKSFHCKLMPTVPQSCVLGVRVPALRKYAKQFPVSFQAFETHLPHRYYEENNLHAIMLSEMDDYACVVPALNRFLPYVDNWATCDMLAPKAFLPCPPGLIQQVREWLRSKHEYTVRFGIGVLLRYYLDENFSPEYLEMVSAIRFDTYYVNMMIAWYFATALSKQYDATIPYITEGRLPTWIHNKTIQKAIESHRIPGKIKDYLRTLKRKSEGA